jgi:hypothetical protein
MARKGRFTTARIYVAGSSVALLIGVWGLLARQDAQSRAANLSTPTDGSSVTSLSGRDDDDSGSSEADDDDQSAAIATATPAPRVAQAPAHATTRGS